jgi:hypothetical protein
MLLLNNESNDHRPKTDQILDDLSGQRFSTVIRRYCSGKPNYQNIDYNQFFYLVNDELNILEDLIKSDSNHPDIDYINLEFKKIEYRMLGFTEIFPMNN